MLDVRSPAAHSNVVADRDEVLCIGDMEMHLKRRDTLKVGLDFFVKLIDYAV